MTRIHKTSTALFLAVAALGLGACGDDNKSSTGGNAATNDAIATDATTGTTDSTTGKTGTNEKTGTTGTSKSKSDDKGGSGGNSGSGNSGGNDSGSGNSGGGNKNTAEKELSSKNVKSTAKTVCTSFLPKALERDLKSGDKSPEDVAKDYSRAFPEAQRKDAYDGCLAGVKSKD